MGMIDWARVTVYRLGSNVRVVFQRQEDDLLLDDDPVGDFLLRKQVGIALPDDEEEMAEQVPDEPPIAQAAPATDPQDQVPKVVKLEDEAADEQDSEDEAGVAEAVPVAQIQEAGVEPEAGAVASMGETAVAVESGQSEDEVVSIPNEDVASADAESGPADAEPVAEVVEEIEAELPEDATGGEDDAPGGEEEKADEYEDEDGLLDVFKTEQLTESPISRLCRDLQDTDVYSLLDEMKWIADRVRQAPRSDE
jgi:hypothetical protein